MIAFEPFEKIRGAFLGRAAGEVSEEFFELKQIHSDRIILLRHFQDAKNNAGAEADAVICSAWGIPIAVRSADCVPILIGHPQRVIAALHAGWRGTLAEILPKTLRKMREEFKLDLGEVRLAIGPAICKNCYEVGPEVAAAFREKSEAGCLTPRNDGKFLLDLKSANRVQALALGLNPEQIEVREECTRCAEQDFFSYRGSLARGETATGRNYSWVMISP
ncbi:MAG TPA: peptidoglycan editing factor PgeF [Deltaproteobacteria bacterium]|nr:peptidoglycan editing factor PgeF [Deltaproteobacteria bacterium]